jgi:hypothetical protein
MRAIALLAPLLSIGGWVLAGLTAANLLSGYMAERTCQTDCVQTLFFAAIAVGVAALILGLVSLLGPRNRTLGWLTLVLAVPLCGILGGIILIGTTA